MVGFLGITLIIASGFVSGQFTQWWNVITNVSNASTNPTGLTKGAPTNLPVDRNQMLLLFGELLFVIIAAKLAETSEAANKVLVALLVGLWFVWAMYNSKPLSDWVNKVQAKPPGG